MTGRIDQRIQKTHEIRNWPGQIPVHNLYTAGVAGERFLRAIQKEGKILATVCERCGGEFVPPKIFCPGCLTELTHWKEVPGRGVVETFTVCHRDLAGNTLDPPDVFAFVRLAKMGGLIHRIAGLPPERVRIGLKVQAIFKPVAERRGSILDIEHFRPY